MLILALQLNGDCHFPPLILRVQWCSKASWSPLRVAIDLPWEFPSPTLYHKSCTMRALLVKFYPLLYFTLSCEQQRELLVFQHLMVISQIFQFLLKDPFLAGSQTSRQGQDTCLRAKHCLEFSPTPAFCCTWIWYWTKLVHMALYANHLLVACPTS